MSLCTALLSFSIHLYMYVIYLVSIVHVFFILMTIILMTSCSIKVQLFLIPRTHLSIPSVFVTCPNNEVLLSFTTSMVSPFSEDEYRKGVAILKNNKAAGRDDVLVEQLKNLGPNAHKWLRAMLNNCFIDNKIPTIWRQSKIIAILKPGKDSAVPKSYRPISLLCHTYKLYERLILNRIAPTIEKHLIKEQAGFRAGKSCTSQLLNLTQHIEDGYQEGKIPELPLLIYLLRTTQ